MCELFQITFLFNLGFLDPCMIFFGDTRPMILFIFTFIRIKLYTMTPSSFNASPPNGEHCHSSFITNYVYIYNLNLVFLRVELHCRVKVWFLTVETFSPSKKTKLNLSIHIKKGSLNALLIHLFYHVYQNSLLFLKSNYLACQVSHLFCQKKKYHTCCHFSPSMCGDKIIFFPLYQLLVEKFHSSPFPVDSYSSSFHSESLFSDLDS